ncbi:MAG: LysR family transcriptional regulator [Mesorhizobium sp.]|uniref:LysR family transcriptional regulator n=1 Tax=Mesorhizobium sp. TaxID=1871066 RepID=UPI000FE4AFB9|nr:LysR family transcriptional regulator [Mesorhizobium sp.]RWJ45249.1 MAG: LysR family transcriptional regulator [Mesorhizobium sp.]RWJ58197.1 MAG: LysR family transcriptional regulator [Mesorhizobium sp.]RWJ66607.1 MAG: LysR family transcriptional regulator [Mesorhizobium sp.]RWJ93923.1 MAG: LysR family transcriptional regulator [Mesorhizobium sp.]TIM56157.1 MAG: LysR family transcriptional regulator [Mesorhizobium sp.]
MEIRQLRYFVGIVDAGSFTKAAALLHVAQSALSLHVRQLEESFGTRLLVRDRTGVTVTASGAKLLERARNILEEVQLTEAELTNSVVSPAGEVTIGIPSGAARVLSGPLLEAARNELPRISLKMIEGMTGPLEEWMAAGRFNLAVLYRTAESVGRMTVLAREEFCLVAPPGEPPLQDSIALADLHAFPLAVPMRHNNARRSVADVVAQHGCVLDVRFEVDSLSTIINMVMEGKAYSVLTPSAIQKEASQGLLHTVKIVDPVITRSVVLFVNPKDERSPAVSAVRKLIPKVARRLIESEHWSATAPDKG